MTNNPTRRSAFTLVEMLVAAALVLFMMYILATAFEKGLEAFRVLKTQGDMQDKIRSAVTALRMDLSTPHFDGSTTLSTQGPYAGDQRLNDQEWVPPTKGYVRVAQPGTVAGFAEGVDPDNAGAVYYRLAPAMINSLYLQMTLNLTDGHPAMRDARGRRDQFFMTGYGPLNQYSQPDYNRDMSGESASNVYTSYWAEVTYFLKQNGRTTDGGATPLYDLYRRQKLLVDPAPPNTYPLPSGTANGNLDVSWWNWSFLPFNGSADVTEPFRRWGMNPVPRSQGKAVGQPYGVPTNAANNSSNGPFPSLYDETGSNYNDPRAGGDLLLTDLVHFDIKALWDPIPVYSVNGQPAAATTKTAENPNTDRFNTSTQAAANFSYPNATTNPEYPFDLLPVGLNPGLNGTGGTTPVRIYDTWTANNETIDNPTYNAPANQDPNVYFGVPPPASQTTPPPAGLTAQPNVQQEFGGWNQGHFTGLNGAANPTPTQLTIPLRVRLRAVQIKLRVWDQKSSQTRQVTIIQDL